MGKPIFGPYITPTTWNDDTPDEETDEFQILQEEDALFFEIIRNGQTVGCVSLTIDTLKELKKVLKKEIKRLEE